MSSIVSELPIFRGFKKPTPNVSLAQTRKVRGYEIKRMPIGAYVAAIDKLNTQKITADLMDALFPDMDADAIFKYLKTIDTAKIGELFMRAFAAVPKYVALLLSELTGVSEDALLNDPAIGLDGIMEIINAWVEVNNLENFMGAVRGLMAKVGTQAAQTKKPANSGSNG